MFVWGEFKAQGLGLQRSKVSGLSFEELDLRVRV